MTSNDVARWRNSREWLNDGECCGDKDSEGICAAPACIFGEAVKELQLAADRIEKLEAALREIGRTFLAEVKSKPEQWTSKQSLFLSHEQAVEVHEELGRRILIARKALEGKDE